jgi:hypothetical protein
MGQLYIKYPVLLNVWSLIQGYLVTIYSSKTALFVVKGDRREQNIQRTILKVRYTPHILLNLASSIAELKLEEIRDLLERSSS